MIFVSILKSMNRDAIVIIAPIQGTTQRDYEHNISNCKAASMARQKNTRTVIIQYTLELF